MLYFLVGLYADFSLSANDFRPDMDTFAPVGTSRSHGGNLVVAQVYCFRAGAKTACSDHLGRVPKLQVETGMMMTT